MVVVAKRLPFESLVRTAEQLSAGVDLPTVLELLAAAAAEATGAEIAIVRVLDEASGLLVARAVAPGGSEEAAELSGSRVAPGSTRPGSFVAPAFADGSVIGEIELVGSGDCLDEAARGLAELAAAQLAVALRTLPRPESLRPSTADRGARLALLEREGRTLAAGAELEHAARRAMQLAAESVGAAAAAIWQRVDERLELLAQVGAWTPPVLEQARRAAGSTIGVWEPALVEDADDGDGVLVSIRIGQPPAGVLQLRCTEPPVAEELVALATFAGRVGHAVSLGESAQELGFELERTRALLSVVGDAITHLSLAHTLDTAVERIAELLTIERVGIYLREGRLLVAAGRGLVDGHEEVADALLELALGPLRPRETIEVRQGSADPMLAPCEAALAAARVKAALAVPLRVHDETIGLLVAYPGRRGRPRTTARCSRPLPASSPSSSRTRGCTSRRLSSARRSGRCWRRSARRRDGCGRSTRSRAPSRAASPSTRRCRRSRGRSSRCSASTRP